MIDVEGLEATNDQFGHAAGDDTLRGVATNLASALRAGDNAYRVGGDEFVLLLPGLGPDDVDGVMERTIAGAQGAVTWGCAWVKGVGDATPDAEQAAYLLQQADHRMLDYQARIRGSREPAAVSPTPIPEPTIELADRFAAANRSRVVIDEAKGLIAEHFDVGIDEASIMLRAFSTAQHQPVLTTAVALVGRTVAAARLRPYRPGQPAATEGAIEQGTRGAAPSRGG
jgi:diguanylate cyclase (GGDEF)-like protein